MLVKVFSHQSWTGLTLEVIENNLKAVCMLTIKVQRGSFQSEVKLHQKHRFGLIDWSLSALKTDLTKVANSWILSCVSTLYFSSSLVVMHSGRLSMLIK